MRTKKLYGPAVWHSEQANRDVLIDAEGCWWNVVNAVVLDRCTSFDDDTWTKSETNPIHLGWYPPAAPLRGFVGTHDGSLWYLAPGDGTTSDFTKAHVYSTVDASTLRTFNGTYRFWRYDDAHKAFGKQADREAGRPAQPHVAPGGGGAQARHPGPRGGRGKLVILCGVPH